MSPSGSLAQRKVKLNLPRKVPTGNDDDDELDKAYMKVTGMTCSSCVNNIERNLMKMEGSRNLSSLNKHDKV